MLYLVACGVLLLAVYIFLPGRAQILVAFIVMNQCFDIVPRINYGIDIWDAGTGLMAIAGGLAFLKPRRMSIRFRPFIILWLAVLAWIFFCALCGVIGLGYPPLATLKACRQMLIGYFSLLIFLRIFVTDPQTIKFLLNGLYVSTFALLPVIIVQALLGEQILSGLHREYLGTTRYLPIFVPVILFFLWRTTARLLSSERITVHEVVYVILALISIVTTYTRGIYLVTVIALTLVAFLTLQSGRLKVGRVASAMVFATLLLSVAGVSGKLDRFVARLSSGFELITFAGQAQTKRASDEDTFTTRLRLAWERLELVADNNPLVGYAFIHEENISSGLRNKLRYGTPVNTPEMLKKYEFGHPYVLALHSVDIGWASLIVDTGITGLILFVAFFVAFILDFIKGRPRFPNQEFDLQVASFVQIVVMVLLMFNGDPFITHVQIPAMILAVYLCTRESAELAEADAATDETPLWERRTDEVTA